MLGNGKLVVWSISIIASFVSILVAWNFGKLLEVGGAVLGLIGLTELTRVLTGRKFSNNQLLPLVLAGLFLVSAGAGEFRRNQDVVELERELEKTKETLEVEKEAAKYFRQQSTNVVEQRQPTTLHDIALNRSGIREVRLLGMNSLSVLQKYRRDLINLLRQENFRIKILLINPESEEFKKRRDLEEEVNNRVADRILYEWKASIAILRDIVNQLVNKFAKPIDLDQLADRLEIRIHNEKPEYSFMFVDTPDEKLLIFNRYLEIKWTPGTAGGSRFVSSGMDLYDSSRAHFDKLWSNATEIDLARLESELSVASPEAADAPYIYSQAVTLHKDGRVDEASKVYGTVMSLDKPRLPTKEEVNLVKRFLPRLFTAADEPFVLKDFVVVLHPTKPLIGYHFIWEDDIDYLQDNDAGDHEIVWIRYDEQKERLEKAWAYWHNNFPCSKDAVLDANQNNGRIRVSVQWGKHGSLLEGWQRMIEVNGERDQANDRLEPLQYDRLHNLGRYTWENEGHYAQRWPDAFKGSEKDFTTFTQEIDLEDKFGQHEMIAVTRYANAVIDQWYLPYNVHPKADWPPEDTENAFCESGE